MSNSDSKYRSRKWILATVSLGLATIFAGFGLFALAEDAGDAALIIGAWAGSDTTILGLYNYANIKANGG
ncbi:unnamed protein product [marine sediment metagenome]|uniref:Uncharacterized protein n=1 Tax=marine sediment metagenome TaxID=412755 RepID=X1EK25_9ZZZZ